MSIKRKLTFMTMGISLASVLLTVGTITTYLIYDIRNSKVQELNLMASIAADRNGAALAFLDQDRVKANLDIYHQSRAMQIACVYDKKKMLFASYEADKRDIPPCPVSFNNNLDMPQETTNLLTSFQEMVKGGEALGYILLVSDTREITAYVRKILLISTISTAFMLILAWGMTLYFRRTISTPILELATTAQAISQNRDYSIKAQVMYTDETGILAKAFNEMIEEVHKRDKELISANEKLEQRVANRTQQLEEAKSKAEAANETKNEFLRNMSHEFRTPLHAIISFSSYGVDESEDAPRENLKKYFSTIQIGADRLVRLVNQVLDLAKLEHGTTELALEDADLCELATRSLEFVSALAKDKSLNVQCQFMNKNARIQCDEDKISQVITNLLSNAIKFTPAGKNITIKIFTEGAQVVLSVIDEGIGIPENEKDAVFESFRQSSRTNTGAGGTGLGLAICRNIIAAHKGSIWAENNANGVGATVTFSVPAISQRNKPSILPTHEAMYENTFAV